MKKVYSGFESSGKSLMLAQESEFLVERNSKWRKMGLKVRPIVSNMSYSIEFENWAADLGIPIVYWKSLEEIKHYTECDIICDEFGKFFDARFWEKLSLEIRTWLSEGAKQGIHWYGGAQDFAQIDLSFRRLVQPGDLIHVTKLMGSPRPSATMPQVNFIWGVLMLQNLDPQGYDEKKKKFESSIIPRFKFIYKHDCQIFNTNKKIEVESNIVKRHLVATCEMPNCTYFHVMHV